MEIEESEKQSIIKTAIQEGLIGLKSTKATLNRTRCFRPNAPNGLTSKAKLEYKKIAPIRDLRDSHLNEKGQDINITEKLPQKFTNTLSFPHSAIGVVIIKKSENDTAYWGSGTLIGPDLVLTAARIVYNDKKPIRKRYPYIRFIPAANGDEAPFGEIEVEEVFAPENYLRHKGWCKEGDLHTDDFAVLILKKRIGKETGYLGLYSPKESGIPRLFELDISVVGYPNYHLEGEENTFEQWGEEGEVFSISSQGRFIRYSVTRSAAHYTGCGVYYTKQSGTSYVIGVHCGGAVGYNMARVITEDKFHELREGIKKARRKKLEEILQSKCDDEYIEELNLKHESLGLSGLEILLGYQFNGLEELDLYDNLIDEKGIEYLRTNADWSKLRTLDLSLNDLGDKGCKALSANITWKITTAPNDNVDDSIVNIVQSKGWPKLEVLKLCSNRIEAQGALALAKNTIWSNLKQLYLSDNQIGDEGGEAIGRNVAWKNLELLALEGNEVGPKTAVSIASNAMWTNIEVLRLANNSIGDEGAVAIGKNVIWKNLKLLNLRYNGVEPQGALAIATNTTWKKLKALYLGENNIGEEAGIAIGKNTTWRDLEILDLSDGQIGDQGAVSIGNNVTWTELIFMDLSRNNIGDEGGSVIGKNTTWDLLEELDLSSNRLSDQSAICFGNNPIWYYLAELDLSRNDIGDEGGAVLGKKVTWRNLEKLDLSCNRLGDQSAISIASNESLSNLDELLLKENCIGDEGGSAIGKNGSWVKLKWLDLSINLMGWKSMVVIGQNSTWVRLKRVNLKGTTKVTQERKNAYRALFHKSSLYDPFTVGKTRGGVLLRSED